MQVFKKIGAGSSEGVTIAARNNGHDNIPRLQNENNYLHERDRAAAPEADSTSAFATLPPHGVPEALRPSRVFRRLIP